MDAIVTGRRQLARVEGVAYRAFVDMSGGSSDDATLAISHHDPETNRNCPRPCFYFSGSARYASCNPRDAVRKFAAELKAWGLARVTGDGLRGQYLPPRLEDLGVVLFGFEPESKSVPLYRRIRAEAEQPSEVDLLDHPKLTEQLLTLVLRAGKIDHLPGDHDDFANAAAGAVVLAADRGATLPIVAPIIVTGASMSNPAFSAIGGRTVMPNFENTGAW